AITDASWLIFLSRRSAIYPLTELPRARASLSLRRSLACSSIHLHGSGVRQPPGRAVPRQRLRRLVVPTGLALATRLGGRHPRHASVYVYDAETNYYLRNRDDDNPVAYDRAANLVRIHYGLRSNDAYAQATNRVVFTYADRCLPNATCDYDHPENWPPAGPGLRRHRRRL